jgi:hypothetical protein
MWTNNKENPKAKKNYYVSFPSLKKEKENKLGLFYSYWVTSMNAYKILMWLVWLNINYNNEWSLKGQMVHLLKAYIWNPIFIKINDFDFDFP